MMPEFSHFTSLPPEQEATFIAYEQKQAERLKTGSTAGIIAGVAIGLITIIIAFAVTPAPDPHAAPPSSGTQKAETGK